MKSKQATNKDKKPRFPWKTGSAYSQGHYEIWLLDQLLEEADRAALSTRYANGETISGSLVACSAPSSFNTWDEDGN